jgi:Mn2+/Fe2+ NRAMP family transporter
MFKKIFKNFGPGPLIAAAFIGPGTVTLCTLAGVNFGMALLWTLLIAIVSCPRAAIHGGKNRDDRQKKYY